MRGCLGRRSGIPRRSGCSGHYRLPKRQCGSCGKTTTAAVAFGQAGAVCYGPNVNAAAVLLSSTGNVPVERTATLMEALLSAPVSTGFVARAHERVADALDQAGFDDAMRAALAAEPVLCADETPVNIAHPDIGEDGQPVPGAPHVVCVRTPDERLVWYRNLLARTKKTLRTLGLFNDYTGYLVRDDYTAWHQFDARPAGVQQCVAHLFRHLQGVLDLHPTQQGWAATVRNVLREAHTAVADAHAAGADRLDPDLLADLRARYDKAVAWGIATNRHRDWDKGNHPGCCSPGCSRCLGPTTPRNKHSKARNCTRKSPATGTPWPPWPGSAESVPT
ncbi:hypothetical protein FDZ84_23480 [Saccharopolyspora sp. ASAGF58]|nr:transposase [Saccharopolyspora sp. ASAGF58]QIZ37060.1 hypothetical protein FDZ84_23480 [Saccharopolyspora sp. ASAGF58]